MLRNCIPMLMLLLVCLFLLLLLCVCVCVGALETGFKVQAGVTGVCHWELKERKEHPIRYYYFFTFLCTLQCDELKLISVDYYYYYYYYIVHFFVSPFHIGTIYCCCCCFCCCTITTRSDGNVFGGGKWAVDTAFYQLSAFVTFAWWLLLLFLLL